MALRSASKPLRYSPTVSPNHPLLWCVEEIDIQGNGNSGRIIMGNDDIYLQQCNTLSQEKLRKILILVFLCKNDFFFIRLWICVVVIQWHNENFLRLCLVNVVFFISIKFVWSMNLRRWNISGKIFLKIKFVFFKKYIVV